VKQWRYGHFKCDVVTFTPEKDGSYARDQQNMATKMTMGASKPITGTAQLGTELGYLSKIIQPNRTH
jgi:hypothetical protein